MFCLKPDDASEPFFPFPSESSIWHSRLAWSPHAIGIILHLAIKATLVDHADFCLLRWSVNCRSTGQREDLKRDELFYWFALQTFDECHWSLKSWNSHPPANPAVLISDDFFVFYACRMMDVRRCSHIWWSMVLKTGSLVAQDVEESQFLDSWNTWNTLHNPQLENQLDPCAQARQCRDFQVPSKPWQHRGCRVASSMPQVQWVLNLQ